jgi:simple sugar transport system permease protein
LATALESIINGAFGEPKKIIEAFKSGDPKVIRYAINPFFESLTVTTPYIFTGLALTVGFRSGLLNMGAEGQVFVGGLASVWVGYSLHDLPAIVHVPLAAGAGMLAGALWAAFPGWLKAKTGAHEVITCIMMNNIAILLVDFMASSPLRDPNVFTPQTPAIAEQAKFFRLFQPPIRFHIGFFIAIATVFIVYFFLFKTTLGFELRQVGLNPHAAKNAGMNTTRLIVVGMAISGALAGLAGANEIQGVQYYLNSTNFTSGYGRNAISLALIGGIHPFGSLAAALFFGFFTSASKFMSLRAGIPHHIIPVIQASIMFFIAAPALVRTIYRLRDSDKSASDIIDVQI